MDFDRPDRCTVVVLYCVTSSLSSLLCNLLAALLQALFFAYDVAASWACVTTFAAPSATFGIACGSILPFHIVFSPFLVRHPLHLTTRPHDMPVSSPACIAKTCPTAVLTTCSVIKPSFGRSFRTTSTFLGRVVSISVTRKTAVLMYSGTNPTTGPDQKSLKCLLNSSPAFARHMLSSSIA
jgi:hypothetical protein